MTFTAHMAWHMALVVVFAPLFAAILKATPYDPVPRAPSLFSPLVACLAEFVIVWMWHLPPFHTAARQDVGWFALEQISFAVAAVYFWMSIIGGPSIAQPSRSAAGLVALVVTFAHMTMLGALIALAPRPLYGHGSLDDQQRGGALMIVVTAIVYPLTAAWLARGLMAARAGSRA
ncbi:MAG TPA: cytochrome c oxidase assembly protein [Vicinamibacterales bacterium]|nr:cytochrome c oxidase assembly protein [Vicinamibacterales bacterium]